jgi:hypothetical protein
MKIIVYALALFSAFFVSSEQLPYDPNNLVPAENNLTGGICSYSSWSIETTSVSECADFILTLPGTSGFVFLNTEQRGSTINLNWNKNGQSSVYTFGTITQPQYGYTCPPDSHPEHTIKVGDMCAKPLPEPTDSCDEFGNNSFLPPNESLNVPAGGSVCHTTSGGSQCQYKKNPFGSGFEQTGQQCTGEETPYPKPDLTPPDNPDDPNACATVGAVDPYAICPVNPNDVCNRIIVSGDGGDKIMNQCPSGCGSVDGQYVCAYPDKNGDGIPDENQDPQKGNDTKDPNDPNDETPDSTKTNNLLYGLDKKLGVGNSRLTGIKTGIEGMTKEQIKGNGSLAAIASNTAKTANNTLGTSENTAEILKSISETEIGDSFNPENAASFYESEYEEGFAGVWQEKSGEFQQTEAYQFLQQFKFNGGGAAPDTSICFNLGQFMDFGCSELPVPDAGLLAILKVFILISAAFLCRRLIFGG